MNSNVYDISASLAGLGAGIILFFVFLAIAWLVMIIIAYVFHSLAFYNFMKDRNLDSAFLAWIPIVNAYAVGKVYDDINEKQGKTTKFSIILLILNCTYWIYSLFLSRVFYPTFAYMFFFYLLNVLLCWVLPIAIVILELICYNLIFKKYAPNNSSYFVLTVIFMIIPIVPFIPGLCLLKASKNQPIAESKIDN